MTGQGGQPTRVGRAAERSGAPAVIKIAERAFGNGSTKLKPNTTSFNQNILSNNF